MSGGDNVIPLPGRGTEMLSATVVLQNELRERDRIIARLQADASRSIRAVGSDQYNRGFFAGIRASSLGMVIAFFSGFCLAMVVMP